MTWQPIRKTAAAVCLLVFVAGGCRTAEVPEVPPSAVASYPALVDEGEVAVVLSETFPMPLDELRKFLETDSRMLMNFTSTERLARPVKAELLSGARWGEDGAVRRLMLEDGHYVLERVVSNVPDRFEYQVWAFTNAAGRDVDYIRGVQSFVPVEPDATRLDWTYSLKPDAGFKRPFVRRFAEREIRPFLESALSRTRAEADAAR